MKNITLPTGYAKIVAKRTGYSHNYVRQVKRGTRVNLKITEAILRVSENYQKKLARLKAKEQELINN